LFFVAPGAPAQIINGFVDGILEGKPVSPDGAEGLDRVRLIDAIYTSARLGREIVLEDSATAAPQLEGVIS
jgi:predicted dehydrogenase